MFDSVAGANRIILMGFNELLDGLARFDIWLADGIFKVVPSMFFQLYSIHFQFGSGINPAGLYCLLPDKTAATYGRLLGQLRQLVPQASPQSILRDQLSMLFKLSILMPVSQVAISTYAKASYAKSTKLD